MQYAFADLQKESIKLAKLVSSSKKTISNLENEISKLNKELDLLRNEVSISKTNEKVNISTINDKCTNSSQVVKLKQVSVSNPLKLCLYLRRWIFD